MTFQKIAQSLQPSSRPSQEVAQSLRIGYREGIRQVDSGKHRRHMEDAKEYVHDGDGRLEVLDAENSDGIDCCIAGNDAAKIQYPLRSARIELEQVLIERFFCSRFMITVEVVIDVTSPLPRGELSSAGLVDDTEGQC